MQKNCTYAKKAAKWWALQIRKENQEERIRSIEVFEKSLANQIQNNVAVNAQMIICTHHHSNFLDKIALEANLNAIIPTGYEMRISMNNVFVYNSIGQLVDNF